MGLNWLPVGKAVIGVILDFRKAASSEWTLRSIRTSVRKQECSFQLLEKHLGIKSSTDGAANVAFPEEEESENGYIVPGENEEDDKLLVTLLDILNSKGKNSIRSGFEDE